MRVGYDVKNITCPVTRHSKYKQFNAHVWKESLHERSRVLEI